MAETPEPAVLVITGVVRPDAIADLCRRVQALLRNPEVDTVTCDLSGLGRPDAVTLDALARMQLTARRLGRSIRVRHPCPELASLLALAGLTDVLTHDEGLPP